MAAVVKELLILFGLSRVNSSILDFRLFHRHTTKPFFCPNRYVCRSAGLQVCRSAGLQVSGAAKRSVVIQQSPEKTQEAAVLFRKMIQCKCSVILSGDIWKNRKKISFCAQLVVGDAS